MAVLTNGPFKCRISIRNLLITAKAITDSTAADVDHVVVAHGTRTKCRKSSTLAHKAVSCTDGSPHRKQAAWKLVALISFFVWQPLYTIKAYQAYFRAK